MIAPDIVRQFTDELLPIELDGGQHTSIRFGNIVLKPITEIEKYTWLGEALSTVPNGEVLIARPQKSRRGNWTESGVGATEYLHGTFETDRLAEKLSAAREFHRLTRSIKRPASFDAWTSPWSLAAQVAWQERPLPAETPIEIKAKIDTLLQQIVPIDLESQFIHSDLAGNILFQNDRAIIIDVSPDFRPVEYAAAILVADSIAWLGAKTDALDLLPFEVEFKKQIVLRAVIFRLCVPVFFDSRNVGKFEEELQGYLPIIKCIGAYIGKGWRGRHKRL